MNKTTNQIIVECVRLEMEHANTEFRKRYAEHYAFLSRRRAEKKFDERYRQDMTGNNGLANDDYKAEERYKTAMTDAEATYNMLKDAYDKAVDTFVG